MEKYYAKTVVIGAGVVGLAIAKAITKGNNAVIILEKQSITNWLNNTCNDKAKKIEIVQRHRDASDYYKSLVQYEETSADIFVNIKHMLVLGQKRLLSR